VVGRKEGLPELERLEIVLARALRSKTKPLGFQRLKRDPICACKTQHGLPQFGDLPANGVQSFNLTSAKQFLIEMEANLRLLGLFALVMPFRTRLNF
jgi:hypothetical protein